jgi:DNA modification methylase
MSELSPDSVDLIITSPPYPMIEMWDSLFSESNYEIKKALEEEDGRKAFLLMHYELNKVWKDCVRVLKKGGLVCINIGDATRKINNNFQLFPNHVLITNFFQENGFISLPLIIWRKPTNAPNKFMGSGMLPPNAYVTHEHEYILLFRKGEKKANIPPKLEQRYNSAYFWEERNNWFSDIWSDLRGTTQSLINDIHRSGDAEDEIRERSAAFPIDLPYRLINMYSIYGETVLDPFWGTGTTTLAAMICARNSIGYDLNSEFGRIFELRLKEVKISSKKINMERLKAHISFINQKAKLGKEIKHENIHYGFKVNTIQEKELLLYSINNITIKSNLYLVDHEPYYLE